MQEIEDTTHGIWKIRRKKGQKSVLYEKWMSTYLFDWLRTSKLSALFYYGLYCRIIIFYLRDAALSFMFLHILLALNIFYFSSASTLSLLSSCFFPSIHPHVSMWPYLSSIAPVHTMWHTSFLFKRKSAPEAALDYDGGDTNYIKVLKKHSTTLTFY